MNRIIKFRIWDNKNKGWVDGFCEYLQSNKIFNFSDCLPNSWVVQQFTGLQDKNGRDTYEGDIINSIDGEKYKVEWLDWCAGFYPFNERNNDYHTNDIEDKDFEIIGNIFENPELLK